MKASYKQITKQLKQVLLEKQKKLPDNFFDILYSECTTPSRIFEVFKNFVYSILVNKSDIDKSAAIDCIFCSVQESPYLLDSLLSALYLWNLTPCDSFTTFHNYLNEELTKKDWSKLNQPSIVKDSKEVDQKEKEGINNKLAPINQCIFEIVFSHTPIEPLSKSQFIDINIDSTLDYLSTKSLNNFADALIIRFAKHPNEIFKRLENRKFNAYDFENKLAISIFRSRDISDIGDHLDEKVVIDSRFQHLNIDSIIFLILKRTFTFNNSNPKIKYNVVDFIPKIKEIFDQLNIKKQKDSFFPYFSLLILPNADYFDDIFIKQVIECPIFPSSNPYFPIRLFKNSEKCKKYITIKVLFDIYKKSGVDDFADFENSFNDAYQNIIVPTDGNENNDNNAEEYRIEMVLKTIFSSYSNLNNDEIEKLNNDEIEKLNKANIFISHVFLWFISNKEEITPLVMHRSIASFINQYYEAVCALTLQAIHSMDQKIIGLFLDLRTLSAIFDQIFANLYQSYNLEDDDGENNQSICNVPNIDSKLALTVIYEISILCYEDDAVVSFWNENVPFIIDMIMRNHPLTADLFQFLHDFLENGNERIVNQILSVFMDDFDLHDDCEGDRTMQFLSQFVNIH